VNKAGDVTIDRNHAAYPPYLESEPASPEPATPSGPVGTIFSAHETLQETHRLSRGALRSRWPDQIGRKPLWLTSSDRKSVSPPIIPGVAPQAVRGWDRQKISRTKPGRRIRREFSSTRRRDAKTVPSDRPQPVDAQSDITRHIDLPRPASSQQGLSSRPRHPRAGHNGSHENQSPPRKDRAQKQSHLRACPCPRPSPRGKYGRTPAISLPSRGQKGVHQDIKARCRRVNESRHGGLTK